MNEANSSQVTSIYILYEVNVYEMETNGYHYIYIYKERDLAHHIMIHYCLLYKRKIIKFGDDKYSI